MVNLFKTLVGKLFTGVFLGAAMIGGGIYYSMTKKENPGEKFEKPSHVIEILNEEHSIPLYNTSTNKHEEDTSLRITAELDKEKNIIYFGNYTKDYNKKDWSKLEERIPVYKRHTQLNSENSTIIIFHPPEVEITKQEQRMFTVPQYTWVADLKPYEEHEEAQMMIEGGEEIIDWALNKLIPGIPFKEFIEYMREEKKERYEEMVNEISDRISDGEYIGTLIPPQIPAKIIGYTETARESKIYFNSDKVEGEIPIYLWANIALGNQTIDYQSPNKYGGLENVLIEFSLRGEKEATKEEVAREERIRKEEGGKIAFTLVGDEEKAEIYIMNFDGTGLEKLANGYSPVWSRDGRYLAFMTKIEKKGGINYPKGISVMDFKKREIKRMLENEYICSAINWSPNGEKLLFSSSNDIMEVLRWWGDFYISLIKKDGTDFKRITEGYDPLWVEDREKIVYVARDKNKERNIYSIPSDDVNAIETITDMKGNELLLDVSKDGKIVFKGETGLYITNLDGKYLKKLPFYSSTAKWFPEGEELLIQFGGEDYDLMMFDYDLMMFNTKTGARKDLVEDMTSYNSKASYSINFTISQNGRYIIYGDRNDICTIDLEKDEKKILIDVYYVTGKRLMLGPGLTFIDAQTFSIQPSSKLEKKIIR